MAYDLQSKAMEEMNRVTIFGDIHGNLPALEAALADMSAERLSPLSVWAIWLAMAISQMK
jgi:hypothetical protein